MKWDTSPETDAERAEPPDDVETLHHEGGSGIPTVTLTVEGMMLDELRQIREVLVADRRDAMADRDERRTDRVYLTRMAVVLVALAGALAVGTIVVRVAGWVGSLVVNH